MRGSWGPCRCLERARARRCAILWVAHPLLPPLSSVTTLWQSGAQRHHLASLDKLHACRSLPSMTHVRSWSLLFEVGYAVCSRRGVQRLWTTYLTAHCSRCLLLRCDHCYQLCAVGHRRGSLCADLRQACCDGRRIQAVKEGDTVSRVDV